MSVSNRNFIHEEIKCTSNSGYAHYQSFQILLSSRLLTKKYDFVSSFVRVSLTLRKDHRLRVYENRELRRIFRPQGGSDGRLEKTA
jgi:hypothetical protein